MSKHRHPARKVSHGQIVNEPPRVANMNEPQWEEAASIGNESGEAQVLPFATENRMPFFEFPMQAALIMLKPWEPLLRMNPFMQWMLPLLPESRTAEMQS